jgi:hypothetical protein
VICSVNYCGVSRGSTNGVGAPSDASLFLAACMQDRHRPVRCSEKASFHFANCSTAPRLIQYTSWRNLMVIEVFLRNIAPSDTEEMCLLLSAIRSTVAR